MKTIFKRCVSDEELGQVSLFIFENKNELHPSFTTLDTVSLLYAYVTKGYLYHGVNAENRTVMASAYYIGTPERDFEDKEVAFVDIVIVDRAYRGTRLFLNGLKHLVSRIMEEHPDVQELRFAALRENEYLCKLYSKFSEASYTREGGIGEEIVFSKKIIKIASILKLSDKV